MKNIIRNILLLIVLWAIVISISLLELEIEFPVAANMLALYFGWNWKRIHNYLFGKED